MSELRPDMSSQEYADVLRKNPEKLQFPGSMLMSDGPKDYVGAVIAITGTLYFRGGHTAERRQAIADCFEAYAELAGKQLKWLWRDEPPSGPPCQPYAQARPFREMIGSLRDNDQVNFQYTSGTKREDASMYTFYVNALRAWKAKKKPGLDFLRFSLPYLDIVEHPLEFQKLFVDFSRRLQALHGHGGFGFVLSPSEWDSDEPTEAFLSRQMAGADVGEPEFMASMLTRDTFKSVGWLTAINREMLETIGGLPALRSELPPSWFALYDYGNGIVIQAGNEPDIAATAIDAKPAQYVLPNAVLKPLRSPKQWLHIMGSDHGEPRMTGVAGDTWMQRFDVSDDALLDIKAKLLDSPRLTKAYTLENAL